MTEPIEKWREEFESSVIENEYAVHYDLSISAESGKYCFYDIELAWQTLLHVKRSQPVVELPKPEKDCFSPCYECGDIHEALTAAGIQYRTKGD